MHVPPFDARLRAGMAATAPALLVGFLPFALQHCPTWLSESSVPTTPPQFASGVMWAFLTDAVLHAIWLLPPCALVQSVITRTSPPDLRTAARGTGIVALCVTVSTLPVTPLLSASATSADWMRQVPVVVAALLFVAVWFALSNVRRSRRSGPLATDVPLIGRESATPTASPRAGRAVMAFAALWVVGLGFLGGLVMDFGGDPTWRHESSAMSPQGTWRADIVDYLGPGGALRSTAAQVYILPASEEWSPNRRGLLIWYAKRADVDSVYWVSNRTLRVHMTSRWDETSASAKRRAHAFERRGFSTQTAVAAGK